MAASVLHLLPLVVVFLAAAADAATFTVTNKCPYTVWAAAVPGGGKQLDNGQTWTIQVPAGTTGGRVWARTGCSFDGNGNGHCQTGDCGGVLQCTQYGQNPNTLAEFGLNQYQGQDFIDISLVAGFNVPMDFLPAGDGAGCPKGGPRCDADVTAQCPAALQVPGGCDDPCTVFKTDQHGRIQRWGGWGSSPPYRYRIPWSPNRALHEFLSKFHGVGGAETRDRAAAGGRRRPVALFSPPKKFPGSAAADQYCCPPAAGSCEPTDYSRFFKGLCPDAYSYPKDDATSIYTCPGGTNYNVIFCP